MKLELREVNKIYPPDIHAVKEFSIQIEDGEFIILVGPSGCGKSTVLRMIAGLEEITDGELFIDDQLMNEIPPKHREISLVFQNYALFSHMTVYENITFGLSVRKTDKKEMKEKAEKAASILNIKHLLERKPSSLSGGEEQRVAIGRAIVSEPNVFLFDEPLSNLDAKLRGDMRRELINLQKEVKGTFVYVTHDQVEAMTMADRMIVMNKGEIQQIGRPENIFNSPANKFVANFIGYPEMNFLEGTIVYKEVYFFSFEDYKWKIPSTFISSIKRYIDKKVTLGIRPGNIKLSEEYDFRVYVEYIENTGMDKHVYGIIEGTTEEVVVTLSTDIQIEIGSYIHVEMDDRKLLFFDPQTTENIENT